MFILNIIILINEYYCCIGINIFTVSMQCDGYFLEYVRLSSTLGSVLGRGNGLLVILAAGINKYQFLLSFTVLEKLCRRCTCLRLVPHFIPPLGKKF